MNKKIVMIMLCLSLSAAVFAGCDKKDSKSDSASGTSTSSSADSGSASTSGSAADDGIPVEDEEDVLACVELGQYKGLELEKTITTVTDQEVEDTITSQYSNTTITDEPCQEGDTVYISYVGKIDGKEFEGGSSSGTAITLGSSGYIEGFDAGVIGMKSGETKDLNLTFPDPYTPKEELSGKPVVFSVTLNNISRPFSELTEDWVKKYTDYATIEEYRAGVKKQLEDQASAADENALQGAAWNIVSENSKVIKYQKSEVDQAAQDMEKTILSMVGDVDAYKKQMGMSDEDYDAQIQAYAKSMAKSSMLIKAIAKTENFSEADQEYKDLLKKLEEDNGMSAAELASQYGQEAVDKAVNSQRVMNLIIGTATVKEVQGDVKDGSTSSSSSK